MSTPKDVSRQAGVGMDIADCCARSLLHYARKRGTTCQGDPTQDTYTRARSFKWVIGVIFILAALYAYFVNHVNLFEAATLFGIGVILI